MKRFYPLILFFLVLLFSCTKEEDIKSTTYDTGTFIVNEGPFGSGTGTISYFDGTILTQDIFGLQNNGNALGNIAQSMIKVEGKYFIAVNNADKLQVVNSSDFKTVGEITNIPLPRYFASAGNKLYVTSYSKDFTKGAIHQIDPTNLKISQTITINGLAERVVSQGDLIYITITSNAYDVFPRNILVLDTKNNIFTDTLVVGDNPNDLIFDKNGDLWVICSGFTDWTNPALNTSGSLHRIKNGASVQNFTLPNGAKGLAIDAKGEKLYYLADGKVWERNLAGDAKVITEGTYYAIGLDKKANKLYLSDALDFQKQGIITQIDLGTFQKVDFTAGIIPTFFYFAQ